MDKTRMFRCVEKTWNPMVGCGYKCVYCWARRQAKRQKHRCLLCYHFVPHLHLGRRVPNAGRIFVCSMGDLFCDAIPNDWIEMILDIVRRYPDREFLFCTKNPRRYHDFEFPENCILGVTIETNRDELCAMFSSAPKPSERFNSFIALKHPRRFQSNEPIMDFDLEVMLDWTRVIAPEVCEIGYDPYFRKLVEPPLSKVKPFIAAKRELGIDVREKGGIEPPERG